MTVTQLLLAVKGLLTALVQAGPMPDGSTFWMPPKASTVAPAVDWVFYFVLAISTFFFLVIVGLMVLFVIRYHRSRGPSRPTASHNLPLEVTWSVIPVILVGFIFYYGFQGFLDMSTPPAGAYEIQVEAQKWSWSFTYPNGYVDSNLHAPVDRPVVLLMSSRDVIHSLYVPVFRIKTDVVPGRYTKAWFQATEPGEYDLFCAEYCGTSHSTMLAKVVVHPPGEFEPWLEQASNFLATMPPLEAGAKLFQVRGCQQCHSLDGSAKTGPTMKDLFGRSEKLADGSQVMVDENYLRESILEPMAKVVAGFDPVMPTYQGRLKDAEIDVVISYVKSLSSNQQRED